MKPRFFTTEVTMKCMCLFMPVKIEFEIGAHRLEQFTVLHAQARYDDGKNIVCWIFLRDSKNEWIVESRTK